MRILTVLTSVVIFLSVWSCPDKDPKCQKCNSKNQCEYCVYSFVNGDGVCQPPSDTVSGCYSYYKDGFCNECMNGYYWNSSGRCLKLDAGLSTTCALSWDSTSTCSHCKNSILATDGICDPIQKCRDPKCDVCFMLGTQQLCYKCVDGYFMFGKTNDSAKCVAQTSSTKGCFYSSQATKCDDCSYGHYYKNATCSPNPENEMGIGLSIARMCSFIVVTIVMAICWF